MNTVDTKLLHEKLLGIENIAKIAIEERFGDLSAMTYGDFEIICHAARELIEHLKWIENLNYIESKILSKPFGGRQYVRDDKSCKNICDTRIEDEWMYAKEQARKRGEDK